MKKMIYVHGYDNDCFELVSNTFGNEYEITDFDVSNESPNDVIEKLKTYDCDLILGTTLGAFYAMMIPKKKILINLIPPNGCYNYRDDEFTDDLVCYLNDLKREFFDKEVNESFKDAKILFSPEILYEYNTFGEIIYSVFKKSIYIRKFNYKNISDKEIKFAYEVTLE